MRNDTHRWTAPGPLSRVGDGITLTEVSVTAQHIVSGPAVRSLFADRLIGWPDRITSDDYVLSLRRDRVLIVGPTDLIPGYDAERGLAVTDVTDGYAAVDLTGPKAFERLRTSAELRLDHPSRSVIRRLFDCDVMLCRLTTDTGFRLHIPRAFSQTITEHLTG